ncbi:hypothetical protein V2J09_016896 [Rumex salicifolius]
MSLVAVVTYTSSSVRRPPILSTGEASDRRLLHHSTTGLRRRLKFSSITTARAFQSPHLFRLLSFRIGCFQRGDAEDLTATNSTDSSQEHPDQLSDLVLGAQEEKFTGTSGSFLAKLGIAVALAITVTVASINFKRTDLGSPLGVQYIADGSSSAMAASSPLGFTFQAFGYKVILPEYAPGWVYFWLLMAAGFGLFISEEALNIWVGITLSRLLTLDGTWQSLAQSFSRNAPYIISTTGASDDVCSRLGIGKDRAMTVSRAVQKYGNLSGFVERFSLGVRNPTSFLAGAMGVSPDCFFVGVCCGGLITLPIQLAIGFLLRERPVFAVATVASVVGIWTVFPYAVAALSALFLYLRGRHST